MQVQIDSSNVQEDTLAEFITALENARPGCHIECKEVYVLEVDDPKAASILQSLFGANGHPEAPKASQAAKAKKAAKKYGKQALIKILNGPRAGEEITGIRLSADLKNHSLDPRTHILHPKKGELIIVDNFNDKDAAYFTISAVGEAFAQAVQS